ncbi:hypothetical protein [Legionella sp. W05-934-2]|uniref:hypothetical protein n=1 Tax=Legionella sp. W05-934-2 TaxID=1198649 RepID=UPI003461BD65
MKKKFYPKNSHNQQHAKQTPSYLSLFPKESFSEEIEEGCAYAKKGNLRQELIKYLALNQSNDIIIVTQKLYSFKEAKRNDEWIFETGIRRLVHHKSQNVLVIPFDIMESNITELTDILVQGNYNTTIYHVGHGYFGIFDDANNAREYADIYLTIFDKLKPKKLKIFGCHTAEALDEREAKSSSSHFRKQFGYQDQDYSRIENTFHVFAQEVSEFTDYPVSGYVGASFERMEKSRHNTHDKKIHSYCVFFTDQKGSEKQIRQHEARVTYQNGKVIESGPNGPIYDKIEKESLGSFFAKTISDVKENRDYVKEQLNPSKEEEQLNPSKID